VEALARDPRRVKITHQGVGLSYRGVGLAAVAEVRGSADGRLAPMAEV
jgi:hypothetical protein